MMKRIRDAVLNCVYNYADNDEKLILELNAIVGHAGNRAYSIFFNVLTHLDLDPETAEKCWQSILVHRKEMMHALNRDVNLRTVIFDYLCSVDRTLKNPVFVEIHVFEDQLKSLQYDSLTGLYTRSTFEEKFNKEFARAKRYATELSVLFFDLDDFKRVNDMFGHLAGDRVLKDVGRIIKNEIRSEDSAARYGGEEFVVILPQTGKVDALILSERIRKKVESLNLNYEDKHIHSTISGGLASFPIDAQTENDLLNYADRALYRAKEFGKNEVVAYSHNKRRYIRISFNGSINIRAVGEGAGCDSYPADAKNISMTGILFESEVFLEFGTKVELTISMSEEKPSFVAIGTVVRVEIFDSSRYEIGVSFLDLEKDSQSEISQYIMRQVGAWKN
jgi:diguanylate cyclase (GGDEF)-like protein